MSVVGFDFGNVNSVIAVAQKGGVDIIANEASNRKTPSIISFGEKERYIGEVAGDQQITNIKNTVLHIKRLIGRKWSDPELQKELPLIGPNKFVELPNDEIGVEVTYRNETHVFTPVQLTSMMFNELRHITEKTCKQKIADLVITVPGYFNVEQRRAVIDAAKIAGINPLAVVNDLTAVAINYGLFKLELSETDPRRVVIVDIGDTSTSAAVVEFYKSKAKIIATAYDKNLGGRDITLALANHFANQFQEKYKVDIRTNPKSWRRMLIGCSKLKPTLNTNPFASINVDFLYDEIDFSAVIKKEEYEALVAELAERVKVPLMEVVEKSKVNKEDIHFVEVVGSGSRTSVFQRTISEFFGRELSYTMNAEEAVAKGCALVTAILSPRFKVRPYTIEDLITNDVYVKWRTINDPSDTKENSTKVFSKNSVYPVPKNVTFNRKKPFSVDYVVEEGDNRIVLGQVVIPKLPKPIPGKENVEIKMRVTYDYSGTVKCESVEAIQEKEFEEEYKVPIEEEEVEMKDEQPEQNSTDKSEGQQEQTQEQEQGQQEQAQEQEQGQQPEQEQGKEEENKENNKEQEKKEKKPKFRIEKRKVKKTVSVPLNFESYYTGSLPQNEIDRLQKIENRFVREKEEAMAIYDAKNALESYIYSSKSKLYDVEGDELEKAKFAQMLEDAENWLYEEGEDQTKEVYENKLKELQEIGKVFFVEKKEEEKPMEVEEETKNDVNSSRYKLWSL